MIKTAGGLIADCKPDNYKKFKFQAKEFKDVLKQWNKKMTVLQEQGYDEKKLINLKTESNKLKDFTYLKLKFHLDPLVQLMRYEVTSDCHQKKMKRTKDCVWKFGMQEYRQVL